ncbi:MAG: 16S rRNA (guanine(966)-N(2))-methyltransferase RsmD [Clostridia bacterium]|nr:16S rRNA (guanine(966)-N(2))-methyltransferase RsmD [Clostridia bacterium]
MRVISGSARGAKLKTIEGNDTRPTTDKVKGAIFNILANDVYGKKVLDLYAGSGALGIEALSRGADMAVFAEKNAAAVEIIKKNLEHTKLVDKAKILKNDVFAVIKTASEKFDLIFLDPPYADELAGTTIKAIDEAKILADGGIIIAETDDGQTLPETVGELRLYDKRKYGRVNINFYKKI